ncbi:porin [Roseateles chitosanitabidus]|jgi:predicted porin|uniref:porin n=1 Tax=Roseateles chitosanitabidus TaxID=65048 RepID=UPI000835CCD7|nr:porin [Roseateles chitosanitabidus]MBO9686966.1 porin [Roseateles chitosanitabidus]
MKKAALALGILAASTSAAWAQSSVQLYGIMDVGLRATSNANAGSSKYQVVPGGMSQSRLGINVTEDLGGGLKAIANLEHRLNSDTGTVAAADFWRQSWVGIQSSDFGRITLGRQYNILFDIYTSTYASFKYSPYIEAYKPEIGLSMGARQDNMVKYLFETGPVRGEIQVSAGEGNSQNKSVGGLLRYAEGAFSLGGAALQVTDTLGKKVKGFTAGGAYTDGPLYVNLSWATNKFDAGGLLGTAYTAGLLGTVLNTAANDVKKRDMVSAGFTYQFTPQWNLGAHYWYAQQTHYSAALANTKSKGHYFAVVADYAFSKRTDAYVELDYTKHKGAVAFANGETSRTGTMVGLRHRF